MTQRQERDSVISQQEGAFYRKFSPERQWRLVTGRIMQAIEDNPEVRQQLVAYIGQPLSEGMALDAIKKVGQVDASLADLPEIFERRLLNYLKLPQVPQGAFLDQPDVFNAGSSVDFETGKVQSGLAWEEKQLVFTRYKFARDIKMLALSAELAERPKELEFKAGEEVKTEHGCKIFLSPNAPKETAELLNPLNWKGRQQIKDRVYLVNTTAGEFILKERKTAFHKHVKERRHVAGNSSKEEFVAAKDLNARGRVDFQNISFEWEEPIAYVEFPDGYQFVVFKKDPEIDKSLEVVSKYGLAYNVGAIRAMSKKIIENKSSYNEEFLQVSEDVSKNKLRTPQAKKHRAGPLQRLNFAFRRKGHLTFEKFAETKAFHLYKKADVYRNFLEQALGYKNLDHDGMVYNIKVNSRSHRINIRVFCFDFEYMTRKNSAQNIDAKAIFKHLLEEYIDKQKAQNIQFDFTHAGRFMDRVEAAAYIALMERDLTAFK